MYNHRHGRSYNPRFGGQNFHDKKSSRIRSATDADARARYYGFIRRASNRIAMPRARDGTRDASDASSSCASEGETVRAVVAAERCADAIDALDGAARDDREDGGDATTRRDGAGRARARARRARVAKTCETIAREARRDRTYAAEATRARVGEAARRALEDVDDATRTRDGGRDASATPRATGRNTAVTAVLALDCEMVGVGADGKRSILARASIVNEDGNVIMDAHVLPTERVTDYRTAVSGVRAKDLTAANGAMAFKKVQAQMSELLRGRILVGHSLKNDMRVLMLDHPKRDTRDTSLYHPLTRPLRPEERCVPGAPRGRGCRALRDLARQHLGLEIQKGEHSSVDDARATLALYKKFAKQWESALRRADGRDKFKKRRVD